MFNDLIEANEENTAPSAEDLNTDLTPQQRFNAAQREYHQEVREFINFLHDDPGTDMQGMDTRYSTAMNLRKFRNTSVCIIGAGGIGSWIARSLVGMGLLHLALVDYDTVELHNVGPQMYPVSDLGRKKVEATADSLREFRGLEIQQIDEKVTSYAQLVETLGHVPDILITAVDNMELRNALFSDLKGVDAANKCPELFIDTRMGLGFWNVYAIPVREVLANDAYRDLLNTYSEEALFDDSEGVYEACTERAIVYTGANIASYVCALIHRWNDTISGDDSVRQAFCYGASVDGFNWRKSFNSQTWTSPEFPEVAQKMVDLYSNQINTLENTRGRLESRLRRVGAAAKILNNARRGGGCQDGVILVPEADSYSVLEVFHDTLAVYFAVLREDVQNARGFRIPGGSLVYLEDRGWSSMLNEREYFASGIGFLDDKTEWGGLVIPSSQVEALIHTDVLQDAVTQKSIVLNQHKCPVVSTEGYTRVWVVDVDATLSGYVRTNEDFLGNSERIIPYEGFSEADMREALQETCGWVRVMPREDDAQTDDSNNRVFQVVNEQGMAVGKCCTHLMCVDYTVMYHSMTREDVLEWIRTEKGRDAPAEPESGFEMQVSIGGVCLEPGAAVYNSRQWHGWAKILRIETPQDAGEREVIVITLEEEGGRTHRYTESVEEFKARVEYLVGPEIAQHVLCEQPEEEPQREPVAPGQPEPTLDAQSHGRAAPQAEGERATLQEVEEHATDLLRSGVGSTRIVSPENLQDRPRTQDPQSVDMGAPQR